jgi:pyruvate dehydrogenase E1 component beta subunit
MLPTALADPDPVIIFEHAGLYGMEEELPDGAGAVPIDRAAVRRVGTDVTLVTFGGMLGRTLDAAATLAEDAISAEVIDLRTLRPLDTESILASVRKTHRAVVIDEEWRSGSFAAEISARIMEGAFFDLDGPVARVCSAEVPMPYARHMEQATLPQTPAIAQAARALVGR